MIDCAEFFDELKKHGVEFFAGVPDSLLKNFCFYVSDHALDSKHIITANEGSAISLACGYHLATGGMPLVYMQNSGIGNAINPLLSLVDEMVYGVPMLLLIGWRGEPGVKDEPQHVKQGETVFTILASMSIPSLILDPSTNLKELLSTAVSESKKRSGPLAILVRKNSFGPYRFKGEEQTDYKLSREEAIECVLGEIGRDDIVVATTGKTSRELLELREKRGETDRADFLVIGSMGHASQIALGIALEKRKNRVVCIDGDGSVLMHAGGISTVAKCRPKNLLHIMINNGAHESVGGQSTGAFNIDWQGVFKAFGYRKVCLALEKGDIVNCLRSAFDESGPVFLEIRTRQGSRADLGRPQVSPREHKDGFMQKLRSMREGS